jgi:hypothetical protein
VTEQPAPVDPFDLPEWLGDSDVVWQPDGSIAATPRVSGRLVGEGHADLACDLLAVDEAYPAPVADDDVRTLTHQSWRHGQIHLAAYAGRLTLLVPGRDFTADRVLDALARFARAVGAPPDRVSAVLNVGRDGSRAAGR